MYSRLQSVMITLFLAIPAMAQITPGPGGGGVGSVTNVATGCGLTGGPITTTGTIKATEPVNLQTGTSYAILGSDCGKMVSQSNASASAYTIAQAGTGLFVSGFFFDLQNRGVGTLTLTPATSTIDGAASLALTTGQGVRIATDGTNYYTQRGVGGSGTSVSPGFAIQVVGTAPYVVSLDTAVAPSNAILQSATNPQICVSASASGTVYTASCGSTLPALATNQWLIWKVDTANTGAATLTIDTLGPLPVVTAANVALTSGQLPAGEYPIWNDGTSWRVMTLTSASSGPTPNVGTFASLPACNSANKGTYTFTNSLYTSASCDGVSTWTYLIGGVAAAFPLPTRTWSNQGTAALVTTNGGETINAGANRADMAGRCVSVTPPFTSTAYITGSASGLANNQISYFFGALDASSNTVGFVTQGNGTGGQWLISKSATFGGAFSAVFHMIDFGASPVSGWFQIQIDSTNIYYRFSLDGINFQPMYQEAKATNIGTANRVCFAVGGVANPNFTSVGTVWSWQ